MIGNKNKKLTEQDEDTYRTGLTVSKHENRFIAWLLSHKKISIPVLILTIVLISSIAAYFIFFNKPETDTPKAVKQTTKKKAEPKPVKYYSSLTGLEVSTEAEVTKPITGVIIENTPEARPQSGLEEAEVVYEAETEGGITRFLALYQQNKPGLIGPVRSLRPFFIDWLKPYDAGIMHVGGSAEALAEIRNGQYRDLDQYFNANSFWRRSDRYAPHNVYTNSENMDAMNVAEEYTTSNPKQQPRADSIPTNATTSQPEASFSIDPSGSPTYISYWNYDPNTKKYLRGQSDGPHTDQEKGQITADVVIQLDQDWWPKEDKRIGIHTTGTGTATIWHQGTKYSANWHKTDSSTPYTFTTTNNTELLLPRGKTWYTIKTQNIRTP